MVQADTAVVKGYGLKRVAYEGGWGIYNGTNGYSSTAGTAAALAKFDSRATTAQTTAHTIFQQSGGDLNIFYTSSDWVPTYIWSLTDEVFNLTTPLFNAVSAIDAASAPSITYGSAIAASGATTLAYGSQLFSDNVYNSGLADDGVLGFVTLVTAPGSYQVSLMVNSTSANKYIQVAADGAAMGGGAISVPVSSSPANVIVGTVTLPVGQHGLIVQGQFASNNNYSGNSCSFSSVTLTPISVVQITAQPTAQTTSVGSSASFSVSASGQNLTYQWEFNGAPLAGQNSSTLTLSNVTGAQAGTYTVIVSNAVGTLVSSPVTLALASTPATVNDTPTMPIWALVLLATLLGFLGVRFSARQSS
jgi:hypothetical protein